MVCWVRAGFGGFRGERTAGFSDGEFAIDVREGYRTNLWLQVPLFFLFVVSFCGIVVPYQGLPYFWQSWMYYLTPFRYLLEAMLALVTHGVPVRCDSSELAKFSAPPGQTCDSYAGPYAQQLGGYVTTLKSGLCGFCQYRDGDAFAASFNVFYSVCAVPLEYL